MEMALAKILVVDDDPAICKLVSRFLTKKNYQIQQAHDGKTALAIFEVFSPDLVILDVNLPDSLGYNLCQEMQEHQDVFILMLTSRSTISDKQEGFLKGADDYLTKPFELQELEFRIKALLKRKRFSLNQPEQPLQVLEFDNLVIDPVRREIRVNNNLVLLTPIEFNLLYFLACFPGRVWNRSELLEQVWKYQHIGEKRVVDVHIGQIRKKIENDAGGPNLIHTVRGVGYRFELTTS